VCDCIWGRYRHDALMRKRSGAVERPGGGIGGSGSEVWPDNRQAMSTISDASTILQEMMKCIDEEAVGVWRKPCSPPRGVKRASTADTQGWVGVDRSLWEYVGDVGKGSGTGPGDRCDV
jgi:hypothetical protein